MNDAEQTPLHEAVLTGDLQRTRALLDAGANTNARDCVGATPLHYAGARGLIIIARLLLDGGANVNVTDHHGLTMKATRP